MEYAGNESSLDSDNSTRNQPESNSESETAEEVASSSGVTPRKRLPARAGRKREWRESVHHTTSLSSQGSDTPPVPAGKPSHARMSLNQTRISPSDSSQRLTRSARRAERSSREEAESGVSVPSLARSDREKRRKGRSERKDEREVFPAPNLQGQSDNESVSGEEQSSAPCSPLPLALVVSIPIENNSSSPEDGSPSDVSSEVSEQLIPGPGQVGGKDMVDGEEYSSKESDGSSCEESPSESSSGESDREEVESSGVRGELDTHSSLGEDSGTGGEDPGETVITQKLRANSKVRENKPSNKSGKSIPGTRKGGDGGSEREGVEKVSRKRIAKRGKKGRSKDENHSRIKHLIELDRKLGGEAVGQRERLQWDSYNLLKARDQQAIFCSPVTDEIAPGYSAVISQPMDFSQMQGKIASGAYDSLEQLYRDFVLMCQNAMTYNKPTTYYYKAAKRIKETGVKMLNKMARDTLKSLERRESHPLPESGGGALHGETGLLVVSIDRSLLPNLKSPKSTSLPCSPRTSHHAPPHEVIAHSTPTRSSALNAAGSVDSMETQSTIQHPANKAESERVDPIVPDTTLLPLPSSFTQKSSLTQATDKRAGEAQPSKIVKDIAIPNTGHRGSPVKRQASSLEFKQKKLKRRREFYKQRFYNNETQARRIYRGSLAPIRPLNYGSFSSFAPTHDSSFANINCQETDRLSSLLEHRDVRGDDDSWMSSNYNSDVSPYYLRLGEGILNMNREKEWSDLSLPYQQRNLPPEVIRMQIRRQQAFQSEMRRRMDEQPAQSQSRGHHQQLDEMLQQSALLITRLSQRQDSDGAGGGQGPGLGEELDNISKILSTIGGNLSLDEVVT